MKVDLVCKVKNKQLPRSKALLPVFEAVVNSFQAIEDLPSPVSRSFIEVIVRRDAMLPDIEIDGPVDGFTITDNGVGFTEDNLDAFFTSDTQYKVGRGGRGIGRFIWLKAFQAAEIESHYMDCGKLMKRAFRFTMSADHPDGPAVLSKAKEPKTTVRLIGMLKPYKDHCPRGLGTIGRVYRPDSARREGSRPGDGPAPAVI